ncbi:MAG: hypothetical protein QOC57_1564 [Ilumatobacteraceae bacterium]|jgi:hypothetical protein
MTWFRRAQDRAQATLGPQEDPKDKPEALLATVFELVREINVNAGKLPAEGVVIARRVLDVVREVIETSGERDLDVHAVVSIRGMLDDYLPTTLRSYLAIDPAVVDAVRPSGRTPSQSFIEQLDVLWSSAMDLLDAIRAHDADALLSQGSFLRTKFSGSDLDL